MKKKNNNWTTAFLVLLLLAGVSLLLYPSLSDYWNSMHQTRAIASYAETVSQLDTAQYDEMWKAAQDYNRSLAQRETAFALTDEQKALFLLECLKHLNPGGAMWIGDVMCAKRQELDALAESCGESWDADECYFAAEDWINRKDMDASFAPQSVCAGVLTLKNI